MKACLVTGTDTAVGKTYVSCLLVQELRAKGINAVGYKPVSSGDREDARLLAEASGGVDIDLINPYHYEVPVAPMVAAMLQGTEVDIDLIRSRFEELCNQYDYVVVEGAGGWLVPYTKEASIGDVFKAYDLPVILVIGNKLGAINHTCLSIQAMKQDGYDRVSLVLNNLQEELDNATITNSGVIESVLNQEIAQQVIQGQTYLELEDLAL